MALNDIYQVTFVSRSSIGQNMCNVFAFRVKQIIGAEPSPMQYLVGLGTAYAAMIKPLLPTGGGLVPDAYAGARLRLVLPTVTAHITDTTGAGNGTRAGDALPPSVCMAVTQQALNAPPHVRGRQYIPRGVTTDVTASGGPTAAYLTDLAAFASFSVTDRIINPVAGVQGTLEPVVWSRKYLTGYTIIASTLEGEFSNQRRRSAINRSDAAIV